MRKKIFVALLCCAMACTPVMAAETVDLSGMSLEDLLTLRTSLEAEILAKGGGEIIGAGLYEAGVDIVAGTFSFTTNGESAYIMTYDTKEEAENDGTYIVYKYMEEGESASVTLQEGNAIYLSSGLYIKIENNSPSWMPMASADDAKDTEENATEAETEDAIE